MSAFPDKCPSSVAGRAALLRAMFDDGWELHPTEDCRLRQVGAGPDGWMDECDAIELYLTETVLPAIKSVRVAEEYHQRIVDESLRNGKALVHARVVIHALRTAGAALADAVEDVQGWRETRVGEACDAWRAAVEQHCTKPHHAGHV